MPRPPARSSVPRSCVNMSKTAGSDSGAMPMPLSLTSMTTSSPSSAASSRMRPFGSVYFAALVSRLATICDTRSGSACITIVACGVTTSSS